MKSVTEQTIWVVDDDESIRWVLEKALRREAYQVESFSHGADLMRALQHAQPDLIISDVRMGEVSGLHLLEQLQKCHPVIPIIIMTAFSDVETAAKAFQKGAFEYISKPFDIAKLLDLIKRALSVHTQAHVNAHRLNTQAFIGQSSVMQELFRVIGRLSQSTVTVLITGSSGVGKELVARALHEHSPRAKQTFVAINTSAIPKELLESELFGHERGAFTGAHSHRIGRFEQAENGTLFLDEIGDMPFDLQTRLLRVLSDGHFYRVGGQQLIQSHVRVLAATHQDMPRLVQEGKFREDLYHRLNVIHLRVPDLKERVDDIPHLFDYFLSKSALQLGMPPKKIHPDAMNILKAYTYPGNVRQLENMAHWMTVMVSGIQIGVQDLPPEIQASHREALPLEWQGAREGNPVLDWRSHLADEIARALSHQEPQVAHQFIQALERILIIEALKQTGGKKQEAAVKLGIGRNTLTRKIQELGLE